MKRHKVLQCLFVPWSMPVPLVRTDTVHDCTDPRMASILAQGAHAFVKCFSKMCCKIVKDSQRVYKGCPYMCLPSEAHLYSTLTGQHSSMHDNQLSHLIAAICMCFTFLKSKALAKGYQLGKTAQVTLILLFLSFSRQIDSKTKKHAAGAVPGAGGPADAHQVHEAGEQGAAAAPGR